MGFISHHAIIVTGTEGDDRLTAAHVKARQLFGHAVSPLIPSPVNDWLTFFVAPDGSKESWPASAAGDGLRDALIAFLIANDDGFESVTWVEVKYASDDGSPPVVVRHSRLRV